MASDNNKSKSGERLSVAVSTTNKFLVSAAIILSLLILVVSQELREYRGKQLKLAEQIQKTARSERESTRKLNSQYSCVRSDLTFEEGARKGAASPELEAKAGINLAEVPRGTAGAHTIVAVERLVEEQKRVESLIARVRDKLQKDLIEIRKRPKKSEPVFLGKKGSTETEAKDPEPRRPKLRWVEKPDWLKCPWSSRGVEELLVFAKIQPGPDSSGRRPAVLLGEDSPLSIAQKTVNDLRAYSNLYIERIAFSHTLVDATKASVELNSAKKSIPTPFGNFEIGPKLALLALGFALLIAYFVFVGYVRRLRALAIEQKHLGKAIAAPYWLPSKEIDSRLIGEHRSAYWKNALGSIAFHIFWLLMAAWLVFQSVFVWGAAKALAFDHKGVSNYLLVLCFIAAIGLALWHFGPERLRDTLTTWKNRAPPFERSRRIFIGLGTMALLGITAASLARLRVRHNRAKRQTREQLGVAVGNSNDWVMHKTSKAIHFRPTCQKHWPKKQNIIPVSNDAGIHAGYEVRMLEALGDQAVNDRMDGLAVSYYQKAIALSPLSYHLYDKSRHTLGRLKQYGQILPMFQTALDNVNNDLHQLAKTRKDRHARRAIKRLEAARSQFEGRIKSTEERQKSSVEYWQKKEK